MMEILNTIFGYFFLYVFYFFIALCALGLVSILFLYLTLPFVLGLFLYLLFTGQYFWAFLAFLGCVIAERVVANLVEHDGEFKPIMDRDSL